MKARGRRLFAALMAVMLLTPVGALAETSFEGTVTSGSTQVVSAPFGGTVSSVSVKVGDRIQAGDVVATVETTKVYAPQSGTITGIFAQSGDNLSDVADRYGAALYITPEHKYSVTADIEKAYNSSGNKYVNIGETVYLRCTSDGDHTAVGVITAVQDTQYTVETIEGELKMGETVKVYRSEEYTAKSRIGQGEVSRTSEVAVTGEGSLIQLHVSDGDTVERGQLLFETVSDSLDGLYATGSEMLSDVSGIVASVSVQAGDVASKGMTLITVYPEEEMQVEILVDEYDLSLIAEGDKVNITFGWDEESSQSVEGTVSMISHISDEESIEAAYRAYIDFEPVEDIRLGMSAVVTTLDGETIGSDSGSES